MAKKFCLTSLRLQSHYYSWNGDRSSHKSVDSRMLTKVEHSNKFSSAVTLGNNQAFGWQTPYEQAIAQGCRRLIMNAINFYNLLYLSDKLRQCPEGQARTELLKTILRSSTHTWHHINLQPGRRSGRV